MNSPSQEVSQAELIALAKEAGFVVFDGMPVHCYAADRAEASYISVTVQLTKFAQLLLQREGGEAQDIQLYSPAMTALVRAAKLASNIEYAQSLDSDQIVFFNAGISAMLDQMQKVFSESAQQPTAPGGDDDPDLIIQLLYGGDGKEPTDYSIEFASWRLLENGGSGKISLYLPTKPQSEAVAGLVKSAEAALVVLNDWNCVCTRDIMEDCTFYADDEIESLEKAIASVKGGQ